MALNKGEMARSAGALGLATASPLPPLSPFGLQRGISKLFPSPLTPVVGVGAAAVARDVYTKADVRFSALGKQPKRTATEGLPRFKLLFNGRDGEVDAIAALEVPRGQQLRRVEDSMTELLLTLPTVLNRARETVACNCEAAGRTPSPGHLLMQPRGRYIRYCNRCLGAVSRAQRVSDMRPNPLELSMRAAVSGSVYENVGHFFPRFGVGELFSESTYYSGLRVLSPVLHDLLDAVMARSRAKYTAYVTALPADVAKASVYVSFDGTWSHRSQGHVCCVTAIAVGVPAGPLLLYRDIAARASPSDTNALRFGSKGDPAASSAQLESVALERVLLAMKAFDLPIYSWCADGDNKSRDVFQHHFPDAKQLYCTNHRVKGVMARFTEWAPADTTKSYMALDALLPGTLRNSAAALPASSTAAAHSLLTSTASSFAQIHVSAELPPAAATAVAPAVARQPDDAADAAYDDESDGALAATVNGALTVIAQREEEDSAPGGTRDLEAVIATTAAMMVDVDDERLTDAALHAQRATAPSATDVTSGAMESVAAFATAMSSGFSYFSALLHRGVDTDAADAGRGSAAAWGRARGAAGDAHDDEDSDGESDSDSDNDLFAGAPTPGDSAAGGGAAAAAAIARVTCACRATCAKRCSCKRANLACSREPGGCACSCAKCTNKHGLVDATGFDRAMADAFQGIYQPLISVDFLVHAYKEIRRRAMQRAVAPTGVQGAPAGGSSGPRGTAGGGSDAGGAPRPTSDSSDDDDDGAASAEGQTAVGVAAGAVTAAAAAPSLALVLTPAEVAELERVVCASVTPEKRLEGMHLGARFRNRFRAVLARDDITSREQFILAMCQSIAHWCNNDPEGHRHCSRRCYLHLLDPERWPCTSDSASADANADAGEADTLIADGDGSSDAAGLPVGLTAPSSRAALRASTSFRLVRSPKLIRFLLTMVGVMADSFEPGSVRVPVTNHNEAANSRLHTAGKRGKHRHYRVHEDLWMDYGLLEYAAGPIWRLHAYEALGFTVGIGTRLHIQQEAGEWERRRAVATTPAYKKKHYAAKAETRRFVRTLRKDSVAMYQRQQELAAEIEALHPNLMGSLTPDEAGVLLHLSRQVATAEAGLTVSTRLTDPLESGPPPSAGANVAGGAAEAAATAAPTIASQAVEVPASQGSRVGSKRQRQSTARAAASVVDEGYGVWPPGEADGGAPGDEDEAPPARQRRRR